MALDDTDITRRIRNLIPDTDQIFGDDGNEYLFDDDAIEDFYIEGQSNVKYAAGLAKLTIGSSEAFILKVITNYETKTDGASLAKQWLAMGQELIAQAKEELAVADGGFFNIIPYADGCIVPEGAPIFRNVNGYCGWF